MACCPLRMQFIFFGFVATIFIFVESRPMTDQCGGESRPGPYYTCGMGNDIWESCLSYCSGDPQYRQNICDLLTECKTMQRECPHLIGPEGYKNITNHCWLTPFIKNGNVTRISGTSTQCELKVVCDGGYGIREEYNGTVVYGDSKTFVAVKECFGFQWAGNSPVCSRIPSGSSAGVKTLPTGTGVLIGLFVTLPILVVLALVIIIVLLHVYKPFSVAAEREAQQQRQAQLNGQVNPHPELNRFQSERVLDWKFPWWLHRFQWVRRCCLYRRFQ